MANGKLTVAQAAVKLFMTGTIAEARQILEIGLAIIVERELMQGSVSAPPRGRPGPKPRPAASQQPTTPSIPAPPGQGTPRRRGRPPGTGSGPTGVVPPAVSNQPATASDAPAAAAGPRRRRPPVVTSPEEQVDPLPVVPPVIGMNELPPQGEPGEE